MEYLCKCNQNCKTKKEVRCLINKITRNFCKYCRLTRCLTLGGMAKKWVISQYIPNVERMKPTRKVKNVELDLEKEVDNDSFSKSEFSTPQSLINETSYIYNNGKTAASSIAKVCYIASV